MTNRERTVKEVVAGLGERDSDALGELRDLHAAIREMVGSAQWLAAALREIAEDTKQLAEAGVTNPAARLASLCDCARHASATAESHAVAFCQLELGIKAWGLADEAPLKNY